MNLNFNNYSFAEAYAYGMADFSDLDKWENDFWKQDLGDYFSEKEEKYREWLGLTKEEMHMFISEDILGQSIKNRLNSEL